MAHNELRKLKELREQSKAKLQDVREAKQIAIRKHEAELNRFQKVMVELQETIATWDRIIELLEAEPPHEG